MNKMHLQPMWKKFDVDYTHIYTAGQSKSTLDHFIVSDGLMDAVTVCAPIHRGDNMSRHSPIFLRLKLKEVKLKTVNNDYSQHCLPSWERASHTEVEDYKASLEQNLTELFSSRSRCLCNDPMCEDESHCEESDSMMLDTLLSIVEKSYATLPLSGKVGKSKHKCKHANEKLLLAGHMK